MRILLAHTADEFKKNEIRTLDRICANGFFENDFPELAQALKNTLYRYKGLKRIQEFTFTADFDIEIEKGVHRVLLHAQVIGDYDLTTYSIGLCKINSNQLFRRFHFDYDHKNPREKQKAPISHLQYGGNAGIGSSGRTFLTDDIESWLSQPRINHSPINLAILLDIVFCEFHDEKSSKIVEDNQWRSLILYNENFIFKKYYQVIAGHIGTDRHKANDLARDIWYGK